MAITERQQQAIDEIMDVFDFERVHQVMKFLNWKWFDSGSVQGALDFESLPMSVPEISEVRQRARKIIRRTIEESNERGGPGYIETCGFCCRVDDETVDLKFIVADWMVDYAK